MKNNNTEKIMTVLMLLISFWVPVAGIVLLFLTRGRYPQLQKKILIATVAGFVVNYALTVMKENSMLWWGGMN